MKSHFPARLSGLFLIGALLLSAPLGASAEEAPAGTAPAAATPARIQWFGTWEAAKAEAQRTGRPILLTSAAPQCKGTPGIW
jgi:hypothetical protein